VVSNIFGDDKLSLVLRYGLFAAIAIFVNIVTQQLVTMATVSMGVNGMLDHLSHYMGLLAGTLAGLVAKYILDKKYIFFYKESSKKDDAKKFFIYSIMGGVTTIVFWAFELGFYHVFNSEVMKYVGAVIGLSIGYYIKYHLDKRFVFRVV